MLIVPTCGNNLRIYSLSWIITVRETDPNEKIFSLEQVKQLIEHLIDHTYVCFAGIIWHQIIGMPMGTNCAGYIANLYCFTCKLDFVERKVREKQYAIAKKSLDIGRYIDDLLASLSSSHSGTYQGATILNTFYS